MTPPNVVLKGSPFTLSVDFPFYQKLIIRLKIIESATGIEKQTLQLPMNETLYRQYFMFFPIASNFLNNLFAGKKS